MIEKIPLVSFQHARSGLSFLNRETNRGRRVYYLPPSRDPMPSVTTIIGKVFPKPALTNWFAKRGREAMSEYLTDYTGEPITAGLLENAVAEAKLRPKTEASDAANLGSSAHDLIARELEGKTVFVPGQLQDVMQGFRDWWESQSLTLIDSEKAVYCKVRGHTWAGTIDALFQRPDRSYLLVDFKTSKAIYPEYNVQLAAYKMCLTRAASILGSHYNVGNPPICVDTQVIRLGKEKPEWEASEIPDAKESERLEELWLSAVDFYSRLEGAS